eukprot:2467006-Rhodomonas_salina.1
MVAVVLRPAVTARFAACARPTPENVSAAAVNGGTASGISGCVAAISRSEHTSPENGRVAAMFALAAAINGGKEQPKTEALTPSGSPSLTAPSPFLPLPAAVYACAYSVDPSPIATCT